MSQKYEIFFGNKLFIITEHSKLEFENFMVFPMEADEFTSADDYFNLMLENSGKYGVVFMSNEPSHLMNRFIKEFVDVKAAGGIVSNEKAELLLIKRRGMWDLPKGKVEEGEFLRQAAIREVKEECGLSKLKIIRTVKPTFHIYEQNEQLVLKTTYWYEMACSDPENSQPQIEEDIEEIIWVKASDLSKYVNKTYPSIQLLMALYSKGK